MIATAQARIAAASQDGDEVTKDEETSDNVDQEATDDTEVSSSKITQSIRQMCSKEFADFFRRPVTFNFRPFMKESFTYFIPPRLPFLDKENAQAPSISLELVFAWTHDVDHVRFFVDYDARTLCLDTPHSILPSTSSTYKMVPEKVKVDLVKIFPVAFYSLYLTLQTEAPPFTSKHTNYSLSAFRLSSCPARMGLPLKAYSSDRMDQPILIAA